MEDEVRELLPLVDAEGTVIGSATRGECHSGSFLMHPVVHLHVFNSRDELYLQKRPEWKKIQPGRWDTAVGGHISFGEAPLAALAREALEELGITLTFKDLSFVARYVFESSVERELIYVYRVIYDGPLTPSSELAGGRFWSATELTAALTTGELTPNFVSEYQKYLL